MTPHSSPLTPHAQDILSAAQRLAGVAHRTPVLTSRYVDELCGARVFFKCENLQRVGAFKFRGAYNALSQLDEAQRRKGVVTYSSGNHGQALALAGKLLQIQVSVVMPDDAPAVKLAAVKGYGATVQLYDPRSEKREALAARIASESGAAIIPPFDHPHIIAGQGTAALELMQDVGALDVLLVPVGGGGLISGSALAAHSLAPQCKVIGVEPAAGNDAMQSLQSKTRVSLPRVPDTIADGARTLALGELTFPIVLQHVHDIVCVPDAALIAAMRLFAQRMKLVVEPTGALAAAALLEKTVTAHDKRVGVIVSGGNVDLAQLAQYFDSH